MSARIRVLVADDHPAVLTGLIALVDSAADLEVVARAADGPEAVRAARHTRPDVALTDVRMPGATGIEITPQLRETGARVLVISAFDLDEQVLGALAAGADGYLVKTELPERILDAIRAVARGDAVLSPAATRAAVSALQRRLPRAPSLPGVSVGSAPALTSREEEVLALLAEGCSNQEIGRTLFVEVSTVKSHVGHAMAKLGVTSRVQAALWWREHRG